MNNLKQKSREKSNLQKLSKFIKIHIGKLHMHKNLTMIVIKHR